MIFLSDQKDGKEDHMDTYEVNKDTCVIISVNDEITKVIETEGEYLVNTSCYKVMENSCEYYGSSYQGRLKGTRAILGSSYKAPIVVEESNELIFFPTESPNSDTCTWFSLNNIASYEKSGGFTKVTFTNGKSIFIKMSTGCFETQVLRANRLGSLMKKRLQ